METGNIIIGMILLTVIVVPFIIMHVKGVNKKNKMLRSLNDLALQKGGQITEQECCGDFAIGIDGNTHHAYFYKQRKGEAISQHADLSEFQACRVIKKTRTVPNPAGNLVLTERVEISLTPAKSGTGDILLELYDEAVNIQLSGELQCAEKWTKLINEQIKKSRP